MKKELISGAPQQERRVRDEEIMSTWSFLVTFVTRGASLSNEEVKIDYFTVFWKSNSFAYIITNKKELKIFKKQILIFHLNQLPSKLDICKQKIFLL